MYEFLARDFTYCSMIFIDRIQDLPMRKHHGKPSATLSAVPLPEGFSGTASWSAALQSSQEQRLILILPSLCMTGPLQCPTRSSDLLRSQAVLTGLYRPSCVLALAYPLQPFASIGLVTWLAWPFQHAYLDGS